MACGFGMAAVRTLANQVPRFRSRHRGPKGASFTESACGGAESERTAFSASTRESMHECVLENDFHDGDEESDVSSEADSSVSEPNEMAARSRTFSSSEIPHPMELLNPERVASYVKSLVSADDDPDVMSNRNSQDDRVAEESDAEEMYSGPLQPRRTWSRRDFPAPSEYLKREELLSLVEGFQCGEQPESYERFA
eukprot:TRINITY_DN5260_c0_g1_i1.p1 TRINITY_DN5260_c0_g1~~TRINITY_DN5260_c0_g1_i1.p1  ORF type:complete len:196 (-),score=24.63 TRINITY_DN5260_c0_g1_i1:433-1020(-)